MSWKLSKGFIPYIIFIIIIIINRKEILFIFSTGNTAGLSELIIWLLYTFLRVSENLSIILQNMLSSI